MSLDFEALHTVHRGDLRGARLAEGYPYLELLAGIDVAHFGSLRWLSLSGLTELNEILRNVQAKLVVDYFGCGCGLGVRAQTHFEVRLTIS